MSLGKDPEWRWPSLHWLPARVRCRHAGCHIMCGHCFRCYPAQPGLLFRGRRMSEAAGAATNSAGEDGTFCDYFARQLASKLGYQQGTVPEAVSLLAACDVVLTQHDGCPFTITCLIDREKNPDRTFDVPKQELQAI